MDSSPSPSLTAIPVFQHWPSTMSRPMPSEQTICCDLVDMRLGCTTNDGMKEMACMYHNVTWMLSKKDMVYILNDPLKRASALV